MHRKRFLNICAALAGIGIVLLGAGIAMGGAVYGIRLDAAGLHVDAPKLDEKNGTNHFESKVEQIEAFDSVKITAQYANILIEPSDSDSYELSYGLYGNRTLSKKMEGTRLVLEQEEHTSVRYKGINVAWFVIGSSDKSDHAQPQEEFITLRLPKGVKLSDLELIAKDADISCAQVQADRMQIGTQYGNVSLFGIQAREVDAEAETGRLQIERVQAENCQAKNEYGEIVLDDITLAGDMNLFTESGDVRFQDTKMRSLFLKSEYGTVEGRQTVFTDMQMTVEGGNCRMEDVLFDRCAIDADYGNVELKLQKDIGDYDYSLTAEYGTIQIGEQSMGEKYASLEQNAEKMVQIHCEDGDILIR